MKCLNSVARGKAKSLLVASVIMLSISAALVFFYVLQEEYLATSIVQGRYFIVYDELRTKVTFLISTMIMAIIIIWLNFYITDIREREKSPRDSQLLRMLTLVFILTLPGSVFAGFVLDRSWYAGLRDAGYSQCENNLFSLSKGFLESAWILDKSWCADPEVRRILLKSHSKEGFRKVNDYLRQNYSL